ncbi:hypothetical protein LZZ85_21015 [Terrimonas sp. NA20]|uniref:DUF2130 domain-containing protein n=1 Tax=Terrimonas ginsenosidimutans TaxID=2908004 RepID=A0ABS9KWV3_9BACT|nr:hypothetical protein [Terrimonas ginsenosidimutans]MCG2616793.1 hypothetical protein [Terrimonas ginsenosidimutans]
MAQFDHLKHLLETIRTIGFWDRLFHWKKVRDQLVLADRDLYSNETVVKEQEKKLILAQQAAQLQKQENQTLGARKDELVSEVAHWKESFFSLQREMEQVKQQHNTLLAAEEIRQHEHGKAIQSLTQIETRIRNERLSELEVQQQTAIDKLRLLKESWNQHEQRVRSAIKTVCQRHTIDYIDKPPFRGIPDNTISICNEFVIIDAKSPAGEDPGNFPSYLKDQAEKAIKYAKQSGVRSDIYFAVPSASLDSLTQFVHRFADHTVYIISTDTIEPVLLHLRKIEEYEFAQELTPEDRNTICSMLGRFAHLSKRRIQVDSFFARQFIQLAYKAEAELPPEILAAVIEFEKSEKLNPPQEKRHKSIPLTEIEKEVHQVRQEADSRGIWMQEDQLGDKLSDLPLYKDNNPL